MSRTSWVSRCGNSMISRCSRQFGPIGVGVAAGGKISAESHRDRARGEFRRAGDDDQPVVADRAGESSGERERYGQPVGHADHDVANLFRSREMLFDVRRMDRHSRPSDFVVRNPASAGSTRVQRTRPTFVETPVALACLPRPRDLRRHGHQQLQLLPLAEMHPP